MELMLLDILNVQEALKMDGMGK